jgi:hypothetical protein
VVLVDIVSQHGDFLERLAGAGEPNLAGVSELLSAGIDW